MRKTYAILKDEEGSLMIITLLIMLIVTLMVVSSVKDSSTELQIARNDSFYKINFFQAEGAARQAVQMMQDLPNPQFNLRPNTTTQSWLNASTFNPATGVWDYAAGTANAANPDLPGTSAGYTVVFNGFASGSGLNMTEPTSLYDYSVFGRSTEDNGDCLIQVGYRIRF